MVMQMKSPTYDACARKGKDCVGWVDRYFHDCLCSSKDDFSFLLGMVSLLFWTVAEIPQIVTNFRNKSGHGVSFGLLFTWVIGDIFNLLGCMLEPVTLPTQLYTALLYTTVTTILVLQTLYYAYCCKYGELQQQDENISKEDNNDDGPSQGSTFDQTNNPIPTIRQPFITSSPRKEMFYTSARSLASGETPPRGSPFFQVKSDPMPPPILLHGSSSSEEEEEEEERTRNPSPQPSESSSRMRRDPSRSVGYGGALLAAAASLPSKTNALMKGQMLLLGNRFMQEKEEEESNAIGLWLGWIMAVIYMGGRLPQIFLNIKRESVEGVNPFMFLFALIANVTYVGSILVRSVEWRRTKSNAPWLLDAIVCVLLDLFVSFQYLFTIFIYYSITIRSKIL
ncbi:hypothetical protein ZOSMA_6G01080 [Zostera marina]|uniref:PQ-loop repeat family protein / transmembrane family protein n=1 Tax=Zostera marina TaxID=29655 RepID=A0A0K9NT18_ZOSMR|nr:hypothetical protein ZOSMA_6G01080 [Zostera marina]